MKIESNLIELKEKFNFNTAKKEISESLNSIVAGISVWIYFGYEDKSGKLKSDYQELDDADGKDLLIFFLIPYELDYEFIDLNNGGFGIKIISNNRVIIADNKIYTRIGTSKKIINSEDYRRILLNKNIEILVPRTIKYDSKDFLKLLGYLFARGFKLKLLDFLVM